MVLWYSHLTAHRIAPKIVCTLYKCLAYREHIHVCQCEWVLYTHFYHAYICVCCSSLRVCNIFSNVFLCLFRVRAHRNWVCRWALITLNSVRGWDSLYSILFSACFSLSRFSAWWRMDWLCDRQRIELSNAMSNIYHWTNEKWWNIFVCVVVAFFVFVFNRILFHAIVAIISTINSVEMIWDPFILWCDFSLQQFSRHSNQPVST